MSLVTHLSAATLLLALAPAASAQVFVNEVLADNEAVLADEAGEFDDWIELYNAGPDAVDLEGFVLSDDLNELDKYTFPAATTIEAGGYLLVWADGDPGQGPLHADFGLSANGEEVALGRPDGSGGFELVDGFAFDAQDEDVSYGRASDGAPTLGFFQTPTPLASNATSTAGADDPDAPALALDAFPNPSRGGVALRLRLPEAASVSGEVVDVLGRVVTRLSRRSVSAGAAEIELGAALAPGSYVVVVRVVGAGGAVTRATRRLSVVR